MTEKIGLEATLEMDDFNKSVKMYISSTTEMNSQTNIFATALGGLSPVMSTVTQALGNILSSAFNAVVSAVQSAASAMIDFGVESVNLATDFQSQMSILSVAASGAGLSMQTLKDAALAVGGDADLLGVSATGAADAMTGLYKAGLSTTLIFGDLQGYLAGTADLGGALRASIDLAAASELDMVAASDLAAITLASFGGQMETDEERANFITLAMNNFVQAADASVASVSDLAAAMMNVAPTAAAMGINIFDLNNALAIMSTRGISGAEAGTALKSMLTNMQRSTPAVEEALRKLNVELYDNEGVMRSLPDIIAQFENAMAGMTQEQKNQYIQTIAGTYGMNAMNTLLQEGTAGWDKMAAATANAAGIQAQAETKAATFAGKMEAMQGVIETLKIRIGDAFLPVLTDMLGVFSEMIEKYGPQIASVFETIGGALSKLFDAISGGGSVGGALAMFFADLGFAELGGTINWLVTMFQQKLLPIFTVTLPGALATAGSFWTNTLLPALTKVWSFIQTSVIPIFQTVVSWFQQMIPIAIQVATDYFNLYLKPAFDSIVEQWNTKLQPAISALWEWLQENIPVAIAFLAQVWETNLKPALDALGIFVSETLIPVIADLAAWFISNVPVAIEAAANAWYTYLYPAFSAAWSFIANTLIPIVGEIVKWLQENIPLAIEAARKFWVEVLLPALQEIWAYIQENILPNFEKMWIWIQENLPAAIKTLETFWLETLLPALTEIWDFIETSIIPIFSSITTWMQETITAAISTLTSFWLETLLPAITEIWTFINDSLIPLWNALADLFNVLLALAIQNLTALWNETLLPAITDIWTFINESLIPIWDDLSTLFTVTLTNAISDLTKLWSETFLPALTAIWTFISEKLLPIFKDIITYFVDTFGPKLTEVKTTKIDALASSFDAVKQAIQWVIDKVNALVEALSKLVVPADLKPGSPPPFYYALKDVGRAMNELSADAIPKLGMEMTHNLDNIVSPRMGQSPMQSITNTRQVNAPINATINNGMDMFAFQARVQQAITGAL